MSYEMWCWVVSEDDGTEGAICGVVPSVSTAPIPLQHHDRQLAEVFRPLAEGHGRLSGKQVRLAHLVET